MDSTTINTTNYEIVPSSRAVSLAGQPRLLSIAAIKSLRDHGFYDHTPVFVDGKRVNDIFNNGRGYNVRINSSDGTLAIDTFSGKPEQAREEVEFYLFQLRGLKLDTCHNDLIEHGKPYTKWKPEPLEVEV
jgi:hypothetical protein